MNKERKITVLCSLHFLDLVHRYATRAIALKDGQVVFQGLPQEIDDAQFKSIYGQEAERVTSSSHRIMEIHPACGICDEHERTGRPGQAVRRSGRRRHALADRPRRGPVQPGPAAIAA